MEPTTLAIYLKGGNVVRLKVSEYKIKYGNIYGDLNEFSWTTVGGDSLPYIRLDEVQAIVEEV